MSTRSNFASLRNPSLTTLCFTAVVLVFSPALADSPAKIGNVNEARVAADTDGANWLLNGRNYESKHFSPLKQITDQNVSGLGLAWSMEVDSGMGIVSEPIVVDGVATSARRSRRSMRWRRQREN